MLMPMLWSNNDIFDEMDNFFRKKLVDNLF